MKKVWILALCLMLLLCGCSEFTYAPEENPEWVQTGITIEEFQERLEENGFEVGNCAGWYITGKKGNQVIVARNNWTAYAYDEDTVEEVRIYTISQAPPEKNFKKIEKGMDLFQVVELIGDVPMFLWSNMAQNHQDSKGNDYMITWEFDEETQKGVVKEVHKYEE